MKRTFFLLTLFLIVATNTWAQKTFRSGNFICRITDEVNSEVEVYNSDTTAVSVDIPLTVVDKNGERYNVTRIGVYGFADSKFLTHVTIPNSIRSIGKGAFVNCKSLKQINIPNSVVTIEDHAFTNCKSLSYISIPGGVKSIGMLAFNHCDALTYITFPSTVERIGDIVFGSDSKIKEIKIYATIPPAISNNTFGLCPSDMQVYVPTNAIGAYKSAEGWKNLKLNTLTPRNKTVNRSVGFSAY